MIPRVRSSDRRRMKKPRPCKGHTATIAESCTAPRERAVSPQHDQPVCASQCFSSECQRALKTSQQGAIPPHLARYPSRQYYALLFEPRALADAHIGIVVIREIALPYEPDVLCYFPRLEDKELCSGVEGHAEEGTLVDLRLEPPRSRKVVRHAPAHGDVAVRPKPNDRDTSRKVTEVLSRLALTPGVDQQTISLFGLALRNLQGFEAISGLGRPVSAGSFRLSTGLRNVGRYFAAGVAIVGLRPFCRSQSFC